MKTRNLFGLALSIMVLLLAAGSGLARGAQPVGYVVASGAKTGSAAKAPWFISTVDQGMGIGSHVSVAIGDSGTTYISYYDATHKDLKMAQYVGSGGNCGPDNEWLCRTLDSSGDVGQYSSIAIDPTTDLPQIAYYDASEQSLKLASTNGVWSSTTIVDSISGSIGRYASLKIDPIGVQHIAFYYEYGVYNQLEYARYVGSGGNIGGGTYQMDIIDSGDGVGQHASLALDGSGQPRIAYYDGGNGDLWYAEPGTIGNCGPGGTWGCRLVSSASDVGQYASLDVDSGNIPHIAYYDATNGKLMYAVYVVGGGNCGFVGSWQCDEITQTGDLPVASPVSLAVDKAGFPIIAYVDNYWTGSGTRSFRRARPAAALGLQGGNCDLNNAWQCEGIDGAWTGAYSAIAVSPSGLATIAYNYSEFVFDPSELRVAEQRFHQVFLPLATKSH